MRNRLLSRELLAGGKIFHSPPCPLPQCPMPNAQCPMPHAQCPMPHAQCPFNQQD